MQNQSTVERVESKQAGISRWGGLLLVLLGGAFFVSSVLGFRLENWWALFILMPALAMFGFGLGIPRQDNGRFSFSSRLFFACGLMVFVVAGMFLVNLEWSVWWPLMIMTPGASLYVVAGKNNSNLTANAWKGLCRWLSLSMIGLGGVFLAHTFGLVNLESFGQFQWWGVFIAFPAMGALLQSVRLYGRLGYVSVSVVALLLSALFLGATAVIELLGIPWTSIYGITAVIFIGSGIILLLNGLRSTNE